jgi:hypothetical protein
VNTRDEIIEAIDLCVDAIGYLYRADGMDDETDRRLLDALARAERAQRIVHAPDSSGLPPLTTRDQWQEVVLADQGEDGGDLHVHRFVGKDKT